MELTYLGAGAVKINGRQLTIVANPFTEENGLGKFGVKADVVLLGQTDITGDFGEAKVFDGPGEYEVKGAMINGVGAQLNVDPDGLRGTMFSANVDGTNVVVVGNIGPKLNDQQIEALGKVDVLVIPVGGHGLTLEPEDAAALVGRFEPSYVIPVHYDDGKTTYPMPQAPVETFFKELGATPEPITKFKTSGREVPMETVAIYLTRP
jgi:hypothetical protein